MYGKRILLIASTFLLGSASENEKDNGFLEFCPGSDQPTLVSDSFLRKQVFFIVQTNYIDRTYRKTYYYGNAVDGIGKDSHVDFKNKKTLVYLDGYLDSTGSPLARVAVGSYPASHYNTLSVDSLLLSGFIFPVTARNIRQIGNITAQVLTGLGKYGLRADDIELFGYSMGGMSAAFTAKHYRRITGRKIGRITGLDAAGPCFRNNGPDHTLSPDDANFVQVIHSASLGFGIARALGHVDFYINGGETQPLFDPYQPWCEDLCSHLLALAHYVSALRNPDRFVGVKCSSVRQAREHKCYDNIPRETNLMGPRADPNKRGIFYVPTRPDAPFYPVQDILKTRQTPLLYNDAMSNVDNFVLSQKTMKYLPMREIVFNTVVG